MKFSSFSHLISISFAISAIVLSLNSCSLLKSSPRNTSSGSQKLPELPISSSLAKAGQTLTYQNMDLTIQNIDVDAYPSTVRYSIEDGPYGNVEIGDWFVYENKLVKFSFQNQQDDAGDGFVLTTFHDLKKLTAKNSSNDDVPLFSVKNLTEGDIKFYSDGFITASEIRDNDPIRREDDSALITVYYKGKKYEGVVREYSHTLLTDGLVLQAGEIFTGRRPGEAKLNFALERIETAFADAGSREEKNFFRKDVLEYKDYSITFDTLPLAPKKGDVGQLLEPEGFRVLFTFTSKDNQKHEFLVLEDQSIRWGAHELLVNGVTPEEGEISLITYAEAKYPTQRLSPFDPISQEEETRNDAAPRKIESFMEVGDILDFADAKFELSKVIENDPTNLYDDQVIVNILGPGIAENVYLRESSRQTIRGNNRWWIVEADLIQKTRRGGQARLAIEGGRFIGRE